MTWPNAGPHATKVIDGKSTGNRANKKRVGQTVASEMRTLPPKITVSSGGLLFRGFPCAVAAGEGAPLAALRAVDGIEPALVRHEPIAPLRCASLVAAHTVYDYDSASAQRR